MTDFFTTRVNNCVDDFYKLYVSDDYISKKRYDLFLDEYNDVFSVINKHRNFENDNYKKVFVISQRGYEMIEVRNKKYVEQHLKKDKEYFDNLFITVDPNILLDEEQRKAILIDEDYSLIIAGAGSGKTTTMAAKVKYLVEKKKINPQNIILLSFTRKATEELDSILNGKFHLNVEVLTFHKLGMKFIRNIVNYPVQIVGDKGVYSLLSAYFTEVVFKDKELLKKYLKYFGEFLKLDDICLAFENYDDYYSHYMDIRYEQNKNNLSDYINKRINERLRIFKTINGEYVRSEGEYRIANFLYQKGINYSYEKAYPYKLINGRSYSPDFTIEDMDRIFYLEYYGMAKKNNDGTYYSDNKDYECEILKKRETHHKNKTNLLEIFGRYEDGESYLSKLYFLLSSHNIKMDNRTNKQVFYRLMETAKDFPYVALIKFLSFFISLYKELNYGDKDFELLKNKTNDDNLKSQLELLKDVFRFYQLKLKESHKIDFQDMIGYAYTNMNLIKDRKKFVNYEYVIVDEYQDISLQRYNFTKKISDLFDAKIVAVGDDWQTIFSFSGSDIQLFTKFYELMGYAEIIKITNTYRNSQELIDLAGEFVCKNNEQILKELKSNKHLEKPVELISYEYSEKSDNLPEQLSMLIQKIYLNNPKHKILLLTRFNDEINNLLDSKLFYKKNNNSEQIICKSCPLAELDILSTHKSKGLGYDQVILLNALNIIKGFPSQIKDNDIIKLLKGISGDPIEIINEIEYPEERRLFYVAMTRTKNKLYIMTPSDFKYRSDFIKEIMDNESVLSCF